jgi:hypothetical protein
MEPENFRLRTKEVTDDAKYSFPSDLPLRPGKSTVGKAIQIRVNQYKVVQWPQKDIFQYDVSFTFTFMVSQFKLRHIADQYRKWCRKERQDYGCLDVSCRSGSPSPNQPPEFNALGWQQALVVCSKSSYILII